MFVLFNNYGNYNCNVGKIMDQAGISISKMGQLTGLNHDIVKKYYSDQIQRIDKDVISKISYVLIQYGQDISNIIEYIPPKKDEIKDNPTNANRED